jgi:dipeptidase D
MQLHYSVRSGVDAERDALSERVKKIAAENGAACETTGAYPAWQYRKDSPLRDAAVRAFEARFGSAPKIEGIHAGLECGLFSGKIPGLDCISMGPDIFDIHSPKERLSVSSTARTYALLWDILKQL